MRILGFPYVNAITRWAVRRAKVGRKEGSRQRASCGRLSAVNGGCGMVVLVVVLLNGRI